MQRADTRLLYLEDETLVARNTLRLLADTGYTAVDHFRRWAEAETALAAHSYDIAILDVQLAGSTLDGIDIGGVVNARFRLPIVVTTSFSDERTLTRLAALPYAQYLHKPFTATQLDACLRRVAKSMPGRDTVLVASDRSHLAERQQETKFVKATGRTLSRIDFADVLYLAADRAYTDIHLISGGQRTVEMGLRATVAYFERDDLFQVHKSYAVPHHAIAHVSREDVELRNKKRLPLGRAYRDDLKRVLG